MTVFTLPPNFFVRMYADKFGQYIQSEKGTLAVVNPVLAKEWHPTKNGALLPEFVSAHSNKKVWWQCEKGHEWEAVINSRNKGHGCMICYHLRRKTQNEENK